MASFERGCLSQAILELDYPHLTPFSPKSIQLPDHATDIIPAVLVSQTDWVRARRPRLEEYSIGHGKALLASVSTADPLSLGISCLMRGMWEGEITDATFKIGWTEMARLGMEWMEEFAPKVGTDRCWTI